MTRGTSVVTLLALAFVLAPWGWARIVLLTALAGLCAPRFAEGVRLEARTVALGAGALFWIANLVSPFWLLPPSTAWRICSLVAFALLAVAWTWMASARVELGPRPIAPWAPIALAVAIAVLCAPGLTAPLEFRGDEDFHSGRVLTLLTLLQAFTRGQAWVALAVAAALVWAALARRLATRVALVLLITAPVVEALLLAAEPPAAALLNKLARYPILSLWAHTAAAFSPAHLWPGQYSAVYDEALYRLVPLAAALTLAGWVLRVVPGPPTRRLAAGLALATMPVVLYYATAAYLEFPAVVLITFGLYGFDLAGRRLLRGRRDLTASALAISIGLSVKELTLPLGVMIASTCGLWALKGRRRTTRLLRWVAIATVLLLPLGLFLVWRGLMPAGRAARPVAFDLTLSALSNPDLGPLLAGALVTQLGPGFLLLVLVGVIAAVRRRPRAAALWALTAVGTLVVLVGTDVRQDGEFFIPAHWGHSRFVLLLLPPMLCFAVEAFRKPGPRAARVLTAIAVATAASHVVLRPIGWDGSRPARWGDVVAETAGERYPYDALYRWAAAAGVRGEMRILGRDYPAPDEFYLRKYGLDVKITAPLDPSRRSPDLHRDDGVAAAMRSLDDELRREAARPGASEVVVVHLRAGGDPNALPETLGTRVRLMRLALRAHVLVVYGEGRLRPAGTSGLSSGP